MQRRLVTFGVVLLAAGLAWPWLQPLGLGRPPGDIVIERESFCRYVPLGTSIVVSAVLSLVPWLLNR